MVDIDYEALAEAIDEVVEVAVAVRSRFEAEGFSPYACEEFALMFVGNLLPGARPEERQ